MVAELRERLLAYRDPTHRRGRRHGRAPPRGHLSAARTPRAAPDLLIETARTVCMIEGLGRKSLMPAGRRPEERTGNHARDGILLAWGPDVRARRDAPDPRPSRTSPRPCCYLLGLPVDADMDGRVLDRRAASRAARGAGDRGQRRALRVARGQRPSATRPTTSSASRTCWRGSGTYESRAPPSSASTTW